MNLQKKLAAKVLGCSPKRVVLSTEHAEELKGAITKFDIRKLIHRGIITVVNKKGISRSRAKKTHQQKAKGRRKGFGSRKGRAGARKDKKGNWINAVRLQRGFISQLKEKQLINNKDYWELYYKVGGGFFRSLNHLKLTINERGLVKK